MFVVYTHSCHIPNRYATGSDTESASTSLFGNSARITMTGTARKRISSLNARLSKTAILCTPSGMARYSHTMGVPRIMGRTNHRKKINGVHPMIYQIVSPGVSGARTQHTIAFMGPLPVDVEERTPPSYQISLRLCVSDEHRKWGL